MKNHVTAGLLVAAAALAATLPQHAAAWDRGRAQTFATLPQGAGNPEGITVDGAGNLYVSTFAPLGTRIRSPTCGFVGAPPSTSVSADTMKSVALACTITPASSATS